MKVFLSKVFAFLVLPGAVLFLSVQCGGQGDMKVIEGPQVKATQLGAADMTEAHYRLVWARDMLKKGRDPFSYGPNFKLIGYDSKAGTEHEILGRVANYRKPLLTSDGERVVYTDYPKREIRVVNFDGTGDRALTKGCATELWRDPATGAEWVYFVQEVNAALLSGGRPLMRYKLDAPDAGTTELVYNHTDITVDTFQISSDGKMAACLYPWPKAGRIDLSNPDPAKRKPARLQNGCWTAMAPDNSYMSWVFDGPHRHLYISRYGETHATKVRIVDAPGVKGAEVYHPKWSNHVRYFTMSGPYANQQKGQVNAIGGGGSFDIYVGRFNDTFQAVDAWTQITDDEWPNQFPDLWIEGGDRAGVQAAPERAQLAAVEGWPKNHVDLQWVWENKLSANEIDPPEDSGQSFRTSDARLVGGAVYGSHGFGVFTEGGIRARRMDSAFAKAVNASKEFTIECSYFAPNLPPNQTPAWGPIALYGTGPESCNVAIVQKQSNALMVQIGNREYAFGGTPKNKPIHLAATYKDEHLTLYWQGHQIKQQKIGPLPEWTSAPLTFGCSADEKHNWDGFMENIAVYSRALSGAEVGANSDHYQQAIVGTVQAPVIEIQAKLVEVTPTASPADIAPYRRYLVEYAYEVEKVLNGKLDDKTIRVFHWSVLDARPLKLPLIKGESYVLAISPKDKRPELVGERSNEGMLKDAGLPAFLDVAVPAPFQ